MLLHVETTSEIFKSATFGAMLFVGSGKYGMYLGYCGNILFLVTEAFISCDCLLTQKCLNV